MISVNLNQINDVLTDFDECVRNIFSTRHQKLRIIFFSGEKRKKFFQILFRKRAYSKRNKLGLDYEELRIGIFSDTIRCRSKTRIERFTERNVLVSKLFRLTVLTETKAGYVSRIRDVVTRLRSFYISPYYFSQRIVFCGIINLLRYLD